MPVPFATLDVAEDAAVAVLQCANAVGGRYAPLADQARRAASSAALNLAESAGRRGRDRAHFFRIALGSAKEAKTALRLLSRSGQVDPAAADAALHLLDRVCAMTWRLVHPNRGSA